MTRHVTVGTMLTLCCLGSLSTLQAQDYGPAWGDPGVASPFSQPMVVYGEGGYVATPIPDSPQWFSDQTPDANYWSFGGNGLWFRTEFLLWNFESPGETLLGSPILGNPDPREPREVFDGAGSPIGFASVAFTDDMRLRDNSGVRGSLGIPTYFGAFEANIFTFAKANDVFFRDLDPSNGFFIGTSTFVNGALADNIELYNDVYRASFTTKIWGAEANLIFNGPDTGFLHLQPIFGFRYMSIDESLTQRGRFTPDPGTGLPAVDTSIDSFSQNDLFIPQIGLRTEFRTPYLILQFDPKFGFGPNAFHNVVRTDDFRSLGDPVVQTEDESTQMSPFIDLTLNGRIPITKNFNFTAGYTFLWAGRVTRPHRNIFYNDNGPLPTPPGIVVRTKKTDMVFEGLTVGGELRY
jgi:hypothetical protein